MLKFASWEIHLLPECQGYVAHGVSLMLKNDLGIAFNIHCQTFLSTKRLVRFEWVGSGGTDEKVLSIHVCLWATVFSPV